MRGKVEDPLLDCPKCGITPAYAGKSFGISVGIGVLLDHPRVCGEKGSFSKSFTAFTGSPPRMRGKVAEYKLCGSLAGITPAYAGKSQICTDGGASTGDHPRVCGEKLLETETEAWYSGSPPRMRGKAQESAS